MPLVRAQCTNCGGLLEVDNSKDAAICPFCQTPYIVEKAINQYQIKNKYEIHHAHITVVGEDVETMVADAGALMNQLNQPEQAYAKYEEISKKHPRDYRGWWGMALCKMKKWQSEDVVDIILPNISRAKVLFPAAADIFDRLYEQFQQAALNINHLEFENNTLAEKIRVDENKKPIPKTLFVLASIFLVLSALWFFVPSFRSLILGTVALMMCAIFVSFGFLHWGVVKKIRNNKAKLEENNNQIKHIQNNLIVEVGSACQDLKTIDSDM